MTRRVALLGLNKCNGLCNGVFGFVNGGGAHCEKRKKRKERKKRGALRPFATRLSFPGVRVIGEQNHRSCVLQSILLRRGSRVPGCASQCPSHGGEARGVPPAAIGGDDNLLCPTEYSVGDKIGVSPPIARQSNPRGEWDDCGGAAYCDKRNARKLMSYRVLCRG